MRALAITLTVVWFTGGCDGTSATRGTPVHDDVAPRAAADAGGAARTPMTFTRWSFALTPVQHEQVLRNGAIGRDQIRTEIAVDAAVRGSTAYLVTAESLSLLTERDPSHLRIHWRTLGEDEKIIRIDDSQPFDDGPVLAISEHGALAAWPTRREGHVGLLAFDADGPTAPNDVEAVSPDKSRPSVWAGTWTAALGDGWLLCVGVHADKVPEDTATICAHVTGTNLTSSWESVAPGHPLALVGNDQDGLILITGPVQLPSATPGAPQVPYRAVFLDRDGKPIATHELDLPADASTRVLATAEGALVVGGARALQVGRDQQIRAVDPVETTTRAIRVAGQTVFADPSHLWRSPTEQIAWPLSNDQKQYTHLFIAGAGAFALTLDGSALVLQPVPTSP